MRSLTGCWQVTREVPRSPRRPLPPRSRHAKCKRVRPWLLKGSVVLGLLDGFVSPCTCSERGTSRGSYMAS
ncbi:hypothetical protein OH77DRAFT_956862 [Trametes cingulata]|nr:hypothetical protein OH77DRAFT_956862 [Trametes cingulata]